MRCGLWRACWVVAADGSVQTQFKGVAFVHLVLAAFGGEKAHDLSVVVFVAVVIVELDSKRKGDRRMLPVIFEQLFKQREGLSARESGSVDQAGLDPKGAFEGNGLDAFAARFAVDGLGEFCKRSEGVALAVDALW